MNTNSNKQTINNECIMKYNRWSLYAKYIDKCNEFNNKIETLPKENEILLKSNRYYENKKSSSLVDSTEIALILATSVKYQVSYIVNMYSFNKYSPKCIRTEIADAILLLEFLNSSMNDALFNRFRNTIYAVRNILYQMDLLSSSLNLSSIEYLQHNEKLYYRERGFLPSLGMIHNM